MFETSFILSMHTILQAWAVTDGLLLYGETGSHQELVVTLLGLAQDSFKHCWWFRAHLGRTDRVCTWHKVFHQHCVTLTLHLWPTVFSVRRFHRTNICWTWRRAAKEATLRSLQGSSSALISKDKCTFIEFHIRTQKTWTRVEPSQSHTCIHM